MKKWILSLLLLQSSAMLFSQALFTYGNEKVSGAEFMRAYNKNKTPAENKEKALRDYLELYINFKLKVKAAREMRLDTLPQLESDLSNFRQQILENYVMDEAETRRLMEEAFARSHKDLHVTYFSVADDNDSAKAGALARSLAEQIRTARSGYASIAENLNQTAGVTAKYRDLGFVTVFSVSHVFENVIYSLKPGEVSTPFHYKKAWHVFKLEDEREAAGKWKVAQIMLVTPPDNDPAKIQAIQRKADSLYGLLKKGDDFATLARDNSEDKMSYGMGGEITEFGTGRFDPSFEKEVFRLQHDGDITAPFRTAFGFHIVKRISRRAIPDDMNDPMISYEMKQQLMEDARMNASRDKMIRAVMEKLAVKRAPGITDAILRQYLDSLVADPANEDDSRFAFSKKQLLQFKGGSRKGSDWLLFCRSLGLSETPSDISDVWKRFASWAAMDYYRSHLEDFNEDFRFQIQEFREGNMLFEAMERNVWGKASEDSVGLLAYYDQHKEKFKWDASADMLVVNTQNKESADFVLDLMKKGRDWRDILETYQEVQLDSGRYELSQVSAAAAEGIPEEGQFSAFSENGDGAVSFVKILKKYPADQQRSFVDARGLAINEYQTVLEKKWIEELRKKYPVKVNEAVFQPLLKSN